jgi:hypothetical protein
MSRLSATTRIDARLRSSCSESRAWRVSQREWLGRRDISRRETEGVATALRRTGESEHWPSAWDRICAGQRHEPNSHSG